MKKLFLISSLLFLLSYFGNAWAEFVVPTLPLTPVYDETGLLSSEDKEGLEQKIYALETETHHQIGIAIISSLQGRTIEEAGIAIGRAWGIGQKGLDNGLLFLIAPTEREMRIEVGRGLEGVMTDLMSKRIIDENLTPNFREGNYAKGFEESIDRIAPLLRGEVVDLPEQSMSSEDLQGIIIFLAVFGWAILSILSASKSWWLGGVIGGVLGLIFVGTIGALGIGIFGLVLDYFLSKYAYNKVGILRSMGNNRWGRGGGFGGFGGGSSGGGWGGFGGGGFGGGGASGKW